MKICDLCRKHKSAGETKLTYPTVGDIDDRLNLVRTFDACTTCINDLLRFTEEGWVAMLTMFASPQGNT